MVRVSGALTAVAIDGSTLPVLERGDVETLFAPYVKAAWMDGLQIGKDVNTSIEEGGYRYRCCLFRDRAGAAASLRLIPTQIPTLDQLFHGSVEATGDILRNLAEQRRGLVLLVGGVGSGKSTTVAAMLDYINATRAERIISIEDPIEYVHHGRLSLFSQREVGLDVDSLEQGALSALRSDLDVALIGELRTPEAVRIALVMAETGHLVFSTLCAETVSDAVQRLVESFPDTQATIRRMLSRTVAAIIAQRLIPRASGAGRAPANEILIGTPEVRQAIAAGEADLTPLMAAGTSGMQTMAQAVARLHDAGVFEQEAAMPAGGITTERLHVTRTKRQDLQ